LPTVQTSSELLRVVADGAAESIDANQILLLLCDVDKKIVVNVVVGGVGREKVGTDVKFDDIWAGLSGWALREQKTAFAPKFMRDARESIEAHNYRLDHDVGSLIVVPLIYQDKILGTLTAINLLDQPDFTPAEADLLTAFGIQATVAIENRNLLNETQKRARREQTLREITTRVNTAVDAESVLQTAVKEVGRAMGLEIFAYLDDSVSIDSSVDAKNVG
jgi:GAF domain-containing protein